MKRTQKDRVGWDEYFMRVALLAADRSTCLRRKVGAVAVVRNRMICTGYNGAVSGADHCLDAGCLREELRVPSGQRHELCKASHAEANVITQAARFGTPLDGATLYCTTFPCSICAKLLVQTGFVRVVFCEGYPDPLSETILTVGKISVLQLLPSTAETPHA